MICTPTVSQQLIFEPLQIAPYDRQPLIGFYAIFKACREVQIDAEPQKFKYQPDQVFLNKFDVFLRIKVVPLDILLSQKIYAIFHRKRAMGRDFYDTVFLLGRSKPNFDFLQEKMAIKDLPGLKKKLLNKCQSLDFKHLAKDVEPFLFDPDKAKKVLHFCDYVKGL